MANVPADLSYTAEHEYVRKTSDASVIQIGITDYAQGELGDVVYVELPKAGTSFDKGAVFGTIEAVKAVSELYCPVAGTVVEANGALEQDPAAVNREPYVAGWMIKMKVKDSGELKGLLNAAAYEKLTAK
jgi:glycine cleavage system H protein